MASVNVVAVLRHDKAMLEIRRIPCDVVLCDVLTPSFTELGLVRQLLAFSQALKVIAISDFEHRGFIDWLLQCGAQGYLTYHCDAKELEHAIRSCYFGKTYVMPSLPTNTSDRFKRFSEKEWQILLMLVHGRRNFEMAALLNLSAKTVSVYHQRVLEKLGMDSDVMLTRWAHEEGLLLFFPKCQNIMSIVSD